MGAGQSLPTADKLRRILIVKTFNSRPSSTSIAAYFRALFEQCDAEGRGHIAFEDARMVAEGLGFAQSEKLDSFLEHFDQDRTGEFHCAPFLDFVEPGAGRGHHAGGRRRPRPQPAQPRARTTGSSRPASAALREQWEQACDERGGDDEWGRDDEEGGGDGEGSGVGLERAEEEEEEGEEEEAEEAEDEGRGAHAAVQRDSSTPVLQALQQQCEQQQRELAMLRALVLGQGEDKRPAAQDSLFNSSASFVRSAADEEGSESETANSQLVGVTTVEDASAATPAPRARGAQRARSRVRKQAAQRRRQQQQLPQQPQPWRTPGRPRPLTAGAGAGTADAQRRRPRTAPQGRRRPLTTKQPRDGDEGRQRRHQEQQRRQEAVEEDEHQAMEEAQFAHARAERELRRQQAAEEVARKAAAGARMAESYDPGSISGSSAASGASRRTTAHKARKPPRSSGAQSTVALDQSTRARRQQRGKVPSGRPAKAFDVRLAAPPHRQPGHEQLVSAAPSAVRKSAPQSPTRLKWARIKKDIADSHANDTTFTGDVVNGVVVAPPAKPPSKPCTWGYRTPMFLKDGGGGQINQYFSGPTSDPGALATSTWVSIEAIANEHENEARKAMAKIAWHKRYNAEYNAATMDLNRKKGRKRCQELWSTVIDVENDEHVHEPDHRPNLG